VLRARQLAVLGKPESRRVYQAGLCYVYLGNVPGHTGARTFCPNCGTILVRRGLLRLLHCDVTPDGRCPRCGQEIAGTGWNWEQK